MALSPTEVPSLLKAHFPQGPPLNFQEFPKLELATLQDGECFGTDARLKVTMFLKKVKSRGNVKLSACHNILCRLICKPVRLFYLTPPLNQQSACRKQCLLSPSLNQGKKLNFQGKFPSEAQHSLILRKLVFFKKQNFTSFGTVKEIQEVQFCYSILRSMLEQMREKQQQKRQFRNTVIFLFLKS